MNPLRQRMIEDMQVRHLAPKTQSSYVQQAAAFARHFHKSPELLGPEDIRTYQVRHGWQAARHSDHRRRTLAPWPALDLLPPRFFLAATGS